MHWKVQHLACAVAHKAWQGIIEIVGSPLLLAGFARARLHHVARDGSRLFHARAPLSFYPLVNHGRREALFSFVFLCVVFAAPGAWSIDEMRAKR